MGKPNSRSESNSKADKKFEKKIQFYSKVGESIAALNAQKTIAKKKKLRTRQKKLKAYDLSSLSEFLPEIKAPRQRTPAATLKVNCKNRTKLILEEQKRMGAVYNDPAFQSNPMAFIYQHLKSMQPVEKDEKLKKKTNINGSKKKREKLKTSDRPSYMEM